MLRFFTLFLSFLLICIIFLPEEVYSQNCNGADGLNVTGGLTQLPGGDICSNTATVPGQMRIEAFNVNDNGTPNIIGFEIDWNDGTLPQIVTVAGGQVTNTGPNAYQAVVTHLFPPTGANVKCEYFPTVRLRVGATTCPFALGIPPRFVRWNTDNQNSGILRVSETSTDVTEYLVCRGIETTVFFTDRTTLNCIPPSLNSTENDRRRWRRYVYGTTNTITSATGVQVASVIQPYPFAGGVVQSAAAGVYAPPSPPLQSLGITIPADAKVNEVFEITMQYWNICNRFDLGRAPVSTTARIRIVEQPVAPTVVNNTVCLGTSPLPSFQTTVAGTPTVTWFRDNLGVPSPIVISSGPSKTLSTGLFPGGINSSTPGVYRVWVSYNAVNNPDGVTCESIKVPVTLTIVESLNQPGVITGPTDICDNQSVVFTLPGAAGSTANGGAAEYEWSSTGGGGITLTSTTATTATFNIAVGGAFTNVNRTIRVRRKYSANISGTGCPSSYRTLPIVVYGASQGGTAAGGGNFCQGADVGAISLTGERGVIQRWEVSTNGGTSFSATALPATNTINPGILATGNYLFRAVVSNGPCAEANSNNVSISVSANPSPATTGIDQALCSMALTSNALGGSDPAPGTGLWTIVTQPAASNVVFNSGTGARNTTITVNKVGVYQLRWTVTNGSCVSSDDIIVDFGTDPGPQTAGSPTSVCGTSFVLNGSTPTIGTGTWTLVSAPGSGTVSFDNPNLPGATVSLTGAPVFGTYNFRWSVISGTCTPRNATVAILFSRPATAAVPVDFNTCVDGSTLAAFTISGTVGGGAGAGQQGRWEIVSGTGSFTSNNTNPGLAKVGPTITDSYKPSAGDFSVGSVQLRLVALDPDGAAANAPCGNVNSTTLTVTFDRVPTNVNAGPDQLLLCASTATLAALAPTNGTGTWLDPNSAGVSFTNINDRNTTISNLPLGNTTLRWSVASTLGVCAAVTEDVLLTRHNLPSVNNLTPEICEQTYGGGTVNNIILTGNDNAVTGGAANTSVAWFTDPVPAGPISPASTPQNISNSSAGSLTFFTRVTNSVTTCQNTGTVTYVINPLPDAEDFSKSFCEDFTVAGDVGSNKVDNIDLNAADIIAGVTGGASDRAITWWLDAAATAQPIATPGDFDIIGSKVVFARVRNTVTNCENVAQVDLVIKARPFDQTIQGKETVCVNALELYQVNPVATASYQWTIPPQFTKFLGGDPTDFLSLVSFPGVATGDIKLTITVNGCAGKELTKTVAVSPTPVPFTIITPNPADPTVEVCENEIGVPFSVTPNNSPGSNYNWDVDPAGGALVSTGQTTGSVLINFFSSNVTIKVTESNSSNCAGPAQQVSIVVNKRPTLADLSSEVCSEDVTGITLSEAGSSVVPAAGYNVISAAIDPGLIPIAGPTTGSNLAANAIINDRFENPTGGSLRVRYTVEPVSIDGCPGPQKIIQVTVKPEPLLDVSVPVPVCSRTPLGRVLVVVSGSVPADFFIIDSVIPDAGLVAGAGNPLALGQFDKNVLADDVWENQTGAQLTVTYNIRPYNSISDCAGTPALPLTFTIYPDPLVTPVTKPICSGDKVNVTLTSINVPGTNFTWTVKSVDTGITGAANGIGSSIQDILTNTSGSAGTVVYAVKAISPALMLNCEGPAQDITITVNPAPAVTNILETICSDVAGGNTVVKDLASLESTINNSGGVTFEWYSDASLATQISPPGLNTYALTNSVSVYAKVSNGTCFNVATVTYIINPLPQLTTTVTLHNGFGVSCNGDSNGRIDADATSGSSPYLYSINGGINYFPTKTFNSLAAGSYVITVKDNKNCTVNSPAIDITEPLALDIVGTPTDAICKGGSTGSISIASSGGVTGTHQYSLNGGPFQIQNSFAGLSASTYTVTVKDANNCTKTTTVTISEPPALKGAITAQTNVSCNGGNDGSVTVLASDGTPGYEYSINNGLTFQVSGTFGPLAQGTYSILIKDINACTTNVNVVITQPAVLTLNLVTKVDVDCHGASTGSLTVSGFGGTAPFQYSLDNFATSQGTGVFPGLPLGSYTVRVRDAKNCETSLPVTINEPLELVGTITSQTNVLCHGTSTGSVSVNGSGGAGTYQFSIDGNPFVPSGTFGGLAVGNYNITIKDQSNCTVVVPVTITEPDALSGSTLQTANVTCFLGANGELTVTPIGGTIPYAYLILEDPSNSTGVTSGVFANVRAGTFRVRISDANGCTFTTDPVIVGQPLELKVSASVTSSFNGFHLSCENASDAVIEAAVTGGTGPVFTYSINPDPNNVGTNTTGVFTNLPAGFYTIFATDVNSCGPARTLPVPVIAPFPFSAGFVGFDQFVCLNSDPGVISSIVPPFGGTGAADYVYQWKESPDDVTYTDVAGANSITYDPPSTLTQTTYFKRFVSLGVGTCPEIETNPVKITINPLPTVSIIGNPPVVCEGANLFVELEFTGQAPFRYDYSATNILGTTGFTNQIGGTQTPIPVFNYRETTTYKVTRVRDFNGCEIFPAAVELTVPVSKVSTGFTIIGPTEQCNGQPFTFQWRKDPRIEYVWSWSDGTQTIIPAKNIPSKDTTITHIYNIPSTGGVTDIPVVLSAHNVDNLCEPMPSTKSVRIFPTVDAVLGIDETTCSGTLIHFDNSSDGASIHKWYYRIQGTTAELEVRNSLDVDYTFVNNTTSNPLVYELIYEGTNAEGCSDSDLIEVTVYRNSVADFDEGTVPPFQGGSSAITVVNTSTENASLFIDGTVFSYAWDFGVDATPEDAADNPSPSIPVVYGSPGNKKITLTVTNRAHASCKTTISKTFQIIVPPLTADFSVTPLASCVPTTIEVVNTAGQADKFIWTVKDEFNKTVSTSNLTDPSFDIQEAGTYSVTLTAILTSTSQQVTKTIEGIEIYLKPFAIFSARPKQFFVPDTNVDFVNESQEANFYEWDFGDGETSIAFEPDHPYLVEGSYTILLTAGFDHGMKDLDGDGTLDDNVICYDTATQVVTAREGGATKIPNAFTPGLSGPTGGSVENGGAAINDVFLPITNGVQEFLMQIFDRWGNLVFESKDKTVGWDGYDKDGRLLPAGVYVYKLILRLADDQRETRIGDVTMIR